MTRSEFEAEVARQHVATNPSGCGGERGPCEACMSRLGMKFITCPVCANVRVVIVGGRISGHTRLVGARRGYHARPQECEGSRTVLR